MRAQQDSQMVHRCYCFCTDRPPWQSAPLSRFLRVRRCRWTTFGGGNLGCYLTRTAPASSPSRSATASWRRSISAGVDKKAKMRAALAQNPNLAPEILRSYLVRKSFRASTSQNEGPFCPRRRRFCCCIWYVPKNLPWKPPKSARAHGICPACLTAHRCQRAPNAAESCARAAARPAPRAAQETAPPRSQASRPSPAATLSRRRRTSRS